METLFENSYTRNGAWAKELYGYFCFKRPFAVVFITISAFLTFASLVMLCLYGSYNIAILCFPIVWGIQIYRYNAGIKLCEKRELELYGTSETFVTLSVTDEYIQQVHTAGNVNTLKYSDIKKVFQTKNYILLQSKANIVYSGKKDGFSVGAAEEFLTFLDKKI